MGGTIIIASLIMVSCGQNSNKQKELELRERELILKEKELALKENKILTKESLPHIDESTDKNFKLIITPQNIEGTLGQVTFQQNEKTLFYFKTKLQKGKIIINETVYVLNKLTFNSNKCSYKISGDQIKITTSNCKYDEEEGGDCAYGKFSSVSITLNDKSTTLYNIKLQDCPEMDY